MQINKEYEQQINIRDMFFYILYHWRSIMLAILIGTLVLGGYTWYTNRNIKNTSVNDEEKKNTETKADTSVAENYEISSRIYQSLIEGNRDYFDHSVIMSIDPYHVWKSTVTFSVYVDNSESIDLANAASYISGILPSLISGNINFEKLAQIYNSTSPEYLKEVISITVIPSATNTIPGFDNNTGDVSNQSQSTLSTYAGLLKINVIGLNKETAEKAIEYIESVVQKTFRELDRQAGSFRTDKSSRNTSMETDKEIENKQSLVAKNISTYQGAITSNNTAISKTAENTSGKNNKKSVKKYAIIGALLGLIAAFGIYAILYIVDGKLHDAEVLKEHYNIPLYGEFFHSRGRHPGKGLDGMIEKWETRGRRPDQDIIFNNIYALIREKGENQHILLTGTIPKARLEEVKTGLMQKFGDANACLETEGSFPENKQAIPQAAKADSVIMVEEKEVSRITTINDMADKLLISQANVIGSVIL